MSKVDFHTDISFNHSFKSVITYFAQKQIIKLRVYRTMEDPLHSNNIWALECKEKFLKGFMIATGFCDTDMLKL